MGKFGGARVAGGDKEISEERGDGEADDGENETGKDSETKAFTVGFFVAFNVFGTIVSADHGGGGDADGHGHRDEKEYGGGGGANGGEGGFF